MNQPTFQKENKQQMNALKLPPHAHEAEQSVLGGLMLDGQAWDRIVDIMTFNDLYNRSHKIIFSAMQHLVDHGSPIDLVTVSERLEQEQQLDDAGGFAYLAEIAKNTPSATNIGSYAKIIRERAIAREVIQAAQEIAEVGFAPEGRDAAELLDFAESKVFKISESRVDEQDGPQPVRSVIEKTVDRIEQLYQNPHNGITGLSSGYQDLDKMTAGFQPADLVIVAARPSMGKTTFAMNLCEHAMMNSDKPVLIFSLEMPSDQIMMRMLASLGRINQTKIRTGQLDDDDWSRLSSTMGSILDQGKMFIDDSSALTPTELRSRARKIARESGGLSMIMVDYLQLMRVPSASDNRTLEIAEISRSLKALAKELNVPVVALSQLNRSLEQRADKRPVNSDLRESGSIEQDADLIMFIYRDEVYHEDSPDKGIAEIIIGKQRNGPIGRVRLTFMGQYSRFDNYADTSFEQENSY